jgi:hypothetical protein
VDEEETTLEVTAASINEIHQWFVGRESFCRRFIWASWWMHLAAKILFLQFL